MDPFPCAPHYHWLKIHLEDLAVICQYGSVENPEHRGITRTWPIIHQGVLFLITQNT